MATPFMRILASMLCVSAVAEAPREAWSYTAQSNLYAAPVVADLHPSPGLEILISDSEARTLRCIASRGNELWSYRGPWTKRQASSAALSTKARPGKTTLAIANGNGVVCALDAQSGEEVWRQTVTRVDHDGLLWADLDCDGRDELVVCGDDGVARALNADGKALWSSDGTAPGLPGRFTGPLAVGDVDGDASPELFGVTEWGVACLTNAGALRWKCEPIARCIGAPIVYRNGDGAELAYVSRDPAALHVARAATGEELWRGPLIGAPDDYSASSLAAGDLDGDGSCDVIACDAHGHVHCFGNGSLRWVFETQKAANAMATIGDVTGDGVPEVVAASGDRSLYCLDATGKLLWRYETGLRLLHPPTLSDVDLDGETDIVLGGGDRILRCIRSGGAYRPDAMPWPSRRADAALSGANIVQAARTSRAARPSHRGHSPERDNAHAESSPGRKAGCIDEHRDLLRDGGFERSSILGGPPGEAEALANYGPFRAQPNGWLLESVGAAMGRDTARKRTGEACARAVSQGAAATMVSQPVQLDRESVAVRARAYALTDKGAVASASIRWIGFSGVVREDTLRRRETDKAGWQKHEAEDKLRPRGARYIQLVLRAEKGGAWWDDAGMTARLRRPPRIAVFANQVGYDVGAPKRFTIESSFPFETGGFEIVARDGATVFRGSVPKPVRIVGAYQSDWGNYYAQCDFAAFDIPGEYRVRATVSGIAAESHPFVLAQSALWDVTARPAFRFFFYQRCGCDVPGYHAACHLDDAVGASGKQYALWGGWHDAGDYNTYTNAPYVFGMFQAYRTLPQRWDTLDEDGNGRSDLVDEILWGADHTRRMIAEDGSAYGEITSGYEYWGPPELETDNTPGTGDERPIRGVESGNDSGSGLAAIAAAARCAGADRAYGEAAIRAYDWRAQRNVRDALQLSAAMDLFAATGNPKFADDARAIVDAVPPDQSEALRRYDAMFGSDHAGAIRESVAARADAMLALADNPFGVYGYGTKVQPNFFGTPYDRGGWHVGNDSHMLEAAAVAAEAYRYTRDTRYVAFVYDQLNWVLGNNPYDLCLMEGVGSKNPPSYHHRYFAAGVPRGAVPGGIVNGITWHTAGDDRPYFDVRGVDVPDFESNEVWLPHNTNYLKAIANLYAARETSGTP